MTEHVLITGGAGFIGAPLARRFHEAGHRVTVLDSFTPQVHGGPDAVAATVRRLQSVAHVIHGTVESDDDIREGLRDATTVIHLAAETGTGQSMYEIDRYVTTNVGGTAKLLDVLGEGGHRVRRIVVASSRAVYGEGSYRTADGRLVHPPHRSISELAAGRFDVTMPGEGPLAVVPTSEDALVHPSSVYGITKHAQESLVMTVAPALGVEPVTLRYQNVYGPGQSLKNPYTGILSIFATLIRLGEEIDIFEDGFESRDFVYIDDVVEATYRAALDPRADGAVLNIGTGVPVTVREVVAALLDAFECDVPTHVSGRYRVGDIRHNVADVERARHLLGFAASVPFQTGVRAFAEWVRSESVDSGAYERSLDEMASRRLLK
ncbi:MAG: wbiB [Microbacterium sp.]|nr:wbiB [Microbacterium sp.]